MNPNIQIETFGTAPNFLESEVGLVLKTHQIPDDLGVAEGSRLVVKAGTPYPADDITAIGLVFTDVDVTNGDAIGSVLVAGRVLIDRLDISEEAVDVLSAYGLKFVDSTGAVVTPTEYDIDIATVDHGAVTADKLSAFAGKKITLTVAPAEGYKLASLAVADADSETVETTKVSDTVYTFVMPESDVDVTPAFTTV